MSNFMNKLLQKLPHKTEASDEEAELFESLPEADQNLAEAGDILDVTPEPTPAEAPAKLGLKGKLAGLFSRKHATAAKAALPSQTPSKSQKTGKGTPPKRRQAHGKGNGPQAAQIAVLIVLAAILFGLWNLMHRSNDTEEPPQVPKTQADAKGNDTLSLLSPDDAIYINPFIDSSQLSTIAQGQEGDRPTLATGTRALPTVPAIPDGSGSYSESHDDTPVAASVPRVSPALPAIPSANISPSNIPSPGEAPLPTGSVNGNFGNGSSSGNPNTVQGILTGDDGSGMAIMGDGSILSAGDSYNDGRIAYIGGDGVHFEDGSTLKYGE